MKKKLEIIYSIVLTFLMTLIIVSLLKIAGSGLPLWLSIIIALCNYIISFGLSKALFKYLNIDSEKELAKPINNMVWKLLKMTNNNWGYTTPLQERFDIGCECKISAYKMKDTNFEIGEIVYIVETGRHDYLIQNKEGVKAIVFQFELI